MRAMVVRKWGEAFKLEERLDPQPDPGQGVLLI